MTLGQDYLRDLCTARTALLSLAAAYNAGAGNLSKWLATQEGNNDPLPFIESRPFAETRDYVKRVMMNFWMYRKRLGEPVQGMDESGRRFAHLSRASGGSRGSMSAARCGFHAAREGQMRSWPSTK